MYTIQIVLQIQHFVINDSFWAIIKKIGNLKRDESKENIWSYCKIILKMEKMEMS